MAINPNLTPPHSLVAAQSSQPQAEAGPAVHAEAPAHKPAAVPAPEAMRPRANADASETELAAARASQRGAGSAQARASSRTQVIAEANRQIDKYVEAREAGVSLAHTAYLKKLADVAVKTAIVGIAVAATVLSAGLAVGLTAPVIALTSVSLAVSMGDAACCRKNWQAAKSQAAGAGGGNMQRLIGGDSCITHGLMTLARVIRTALAKRFGEESKFVASEAHADMIAKGFSLGFKIGLGVATAWATAGLTGAAVGATSAIQAGAHLAKVGFLATSATGAAINLFTVIKRGFMEGQFSRLNKRSGETPDLYKAEIPRRERGAQRLNSIANDSLQLMIKSPKAFQKALRADTHESRSNARSGAASRIQQTFGDDANKMRANPSGDGVVFNASKARGFASDAQGPLEDIGNAGVNAVQFLVTGFGIANNHFGWIDP